MEFEEYTQDVLSKVSKSLAELEDAIDKISKIYPIEK